MTSAAIAHAFTALLAAGKDEEAQAYWAENLVSVEAFPGEYQVTRGRAGVLAKHKVWTESTVVHDVRSEGPFINGDQFAILFQVDCTGPDGRRQVMREVALYTVKDGAITEERFLPLMAGEGAPAPAG